MAQNLVDSYLAYLESIRVPDDLPSDPDAAADVLRRVQERVFHNPHLSASDDLDEMIATAPRSAWPLIAEIVDRAHAGDHAMLGAGVLQTFTHMHAASFADQLDEKIRTSDHFFRAFQYVAMTGVPLAIQQRLNASLLARGADPKLVVEYDETEDDAAGP
jgi:hypothetical protein